MQYQNLMDFHAVLAKRFLAKYKYLVVKMGDDLDGNASARKNYELCDCDIVLGSTCVLPMLEAMQSLSKLA